MNTPEQAAITTSPTQTRDKIMIFSWEGLLRVCEVVSIIAGAVTVIALIGQVTANRVLSGRQNLEMQNLRLAVATQQERAAKAEQALIEVQQKTRDRHLTPGLLDDLTTFARKYGRETLIIVEAGNSEETSKLANLIGMAVKLGGWDVQIERHAPNSANPEYGMNCFINPRKQDLGTEFVEVFRQKGLRIEFTKGYSSNAAMVLHVGLRP